MSFLLLACSRSPWVKPDGDEVSPNEQVECAHQVQQARKGDVLKQAVLEEHIEQCLLDKGYYRRPWWNLSDLHWHLKEPAY